jgi:hypothetical protein
MAKEWDTKYFSNQQSLVSRIDVSDFVDQEKILVKGQIRCDNCQNFFPFEIVILSQKADSHIKSCPHCDGEINLESYWEDAFHVIVETGPASADSDHPGSAAEIRIQDVGDVTEKPLTDPLFQAIKAGQADHVLDLIETGADIMSHDPEGVSVLCNAVYYLPVEVLEYIIKKGADVNESCRDGLLPLKVAAIRGDPRIINLLLEKGADINAQDDNGNTALMEAAAYGHEKIVQRLLGVGADKTVRSLDGKTASTLAREYGHQNIADIIEKYNITEDDNYTMKSYKSSGTTDRLLNSITSNYKPIFLIGGVLVFLLLICTVYKNREGDPNKNQMQKQQLQHMIDSYDSFKRDVERNPTEFKRAQLKEFELNIEKFIQDHDPSVGQIWILYKQGQNNPPSSAVEPPQTITQTPGVTVLPGEETPSATPPAPVKKPQVTPVPEVVKTPTTHNWFDVANVESWDTLNMRVRADYRSDKTGTIPYNAKCVRNLGQTTKVGRYVWIKVEYHSATGWVNSHFLKPATTCN